MKKLFFLMISVLMSFASSDLVIKSSQCSVDITMNKLENILINKGLTIFARIDHKQNAVDVNMTLRDSQVIIFGNPKGGTVLMQKDPTVSLELPLRVAVYKDDDGKVWLSYHNPQSLKDSYNVSAAAEVLNKVEGGLDKLTSAATK